MLGWPWNTFGRKNSAGRTFSQQRAMVVCFMEKAKSVDPDAFTAGGLISFWPTISDERQRKAFEEAVGSRV